MYSRRWNGSGIFRWNIGDEGEFEQEHKLADSEQVYCIPLLSLMGIVQASIICSDRFVAAEFHLPGGLWKVRREWVERWTAKVESGSKQFILYWYIGWMFFFRRRNIARYRLLSLVHAQRKWIYFFYSKIYSRTIRWKWWNKYSRVSIELARVFSKSKSHPTSPSRPIHVMHVTVSRSGTWAGWWVCERILIIIIIVWRQQPRLLGWVRQPSKIKHLPRLF